MADRIPYRMPTGTVHGPAVFRIRKVLGLPDPDPLVRGTDPDQAKII
jgi:hypothetical protein